MHTIRSSRRRAIVRAAVSQPSPCSHRRLVSRASATAAAMGINRSHRQQEEKSPWQPGQELTRNVGGRHSLVQMRSPQ